MGDAGSPPPPPSSSSTMSHHQPVCSGLPSAHPTASFWQTSFPNPLAHHRSTPELPAHADVVVVGTGISGTFAVDELLSMKVNNTARAAATDLNHHDHGSGLTVLALDARTLCSAATGRNGGHLQPVIHNAPAHIIDFELRNFHHVEALASSASGGGGAEYGSGNGSSHDEPTGSSSSSSSPSWCDFRRLEGCLGFWNEEYFREAKRDLAATAAAAAAAATNADGATDTNKNSPADDYAGLARVVEDAQGLAALGLRVQSGAVGAIVQSVAASLSPYKLCVGVWRSLLERFEEGGDTASGRDGGEGHGTKTATHTQGTEGRTPRRRLNLQTDTPVTALERGGTSDSRRGDGWIVHTPRGSVHAHTVILATNGYTSHVLPGFARLIRPVQAQMSALVPPPAGGLAGKRPQENNNDDDAERKLIPMSYGFMGVGAMDRVMSDYLVQNPYNNSSHNSHTVPHDPAAGGGHLMFGGGRHLALHHGEGVWDDDFVDHSVERYLRSLPERLDLDLDMHDNDDDDDDDEGPAARSPPPPTLAIAASWTGIIGHSADGHPWVGGAPDHAGVFVCAGYTGHGMTNAPLCGRAVARRALTAAMEKGGGDVIATTGQGAVDVDVGVGVDVPPEYLITRERIARVLRARQ